MRNHVSSFHNCNKAYSLLSVSSRYSSYTQKFTTIGSGFPSMRPFGVWSKAVFGLRKHNLASTPNKVFRGSTILALKSFLSLTDLVLSFLILISIHVEQHRKCASAHGTLHEIINI